MTYIITRRDTLRLAAGGAALAALSERVAAQPVPRAEVAAPKLPIENGATLRILRPARFVEPDETIFRANTAKFQQATGIETRVASSAEDIAAGAVASNTGTGPDIVLGWAEDPHVYVDKLIDLSDVAEYLGKRYGGWSFLAEKYGKRDKITTGSAFVRRSLRPAGLSQVCREGAGYDKIPNDHAEYLKLCQAPEAEQAAGLCARQCGRRRQRLCQLADLVAWRLSGRRGRQGRDQQQGDDRGPEVPEGPLSDLRAGHAVLG